MGKQNSDQEKKCPSAKDLWRLALAIIGVAAIHRPTPDLRTLQLASCRPDE